MKDLQFIEDYEEQQICAFEKVESVKFEHFC